MMIYSVYCRICISAEMYQGSIAFDISARWRSLWAVLQINKLDCFMVLLALQESCTNVMEYFDNLSGIKDTRDYQKTDVIRWLYI